MSGFSIFHAISVRGFKHLWTMITLALALAGCVNGKGPSSAAMPGAMETQPVAGSPALPGAPGTIYTTGTISASGMPVGGESPPQPPVTVQSLRLVLRSAAEINAAKQGSNAIIAQPLAADLWQTLTIDSGTAEATGRSRFATAADLDQLKLSQTDAFTLGLQNAAADLPNLTTVTHDLTPHQIGVIQSKREETSRLLLAKDWAPLAQALDGRLLVAVPANDTLLYCVENGTQSVRTFAAAARDTAAKAGHAVSPALLRWTPAGWQSVLVP